MNPVPYISAFARPGGRWSPVRIIAMILLLALVVLLLFKILKPVFEFFGFGDGNKGDRSDFSIDTEAVIEQIKAKGLTVSDDFNPAYWVNEFKEALDKWIFWADSQRCQVYTNANLLNDAELAVVAALYADATGRTLRNHIEAQNLNGCWLAHPEEILLDRLNRIELESLY